MEDRDLADYFEACAAALRDASPKMAANWITGELFAWLNQHNQSLAGIQMSPAALAGLLDTAARGAVNLNTAKSVLAEMLTGGRSADGIIREQGPGQGSRTGRNGRRGREALAANPDEVAKYLAGKETVANWLYGQVMRAAKGKANPQVIQAELQAQLARLKP